MTDPIDSADEIAALKADNARLRRLLDEVGMPDSLRHALRDTVTMLRTMLRRSAENAEDVESYAAHLDGRLVAITRVRTATEAFGEADLHTLISDELQSHLVREGERATLGGPRVRLRPKPAQVFAMAVHELTSNAVEHGAMALPHGRVDVRWSVQPAGSGAEASEPILALDWKEAGGRGVTEPARSGFGTEMLTEMLAYDLGARAILAYEPDGLRCTLHLPLTGKVGRVVEDGDITAPSWDSEFS